MLVKDRLRSMLDTFAVVGDPRESRKAKPALPEMFFLVTRTSIAGYDDYGEIAA